MMLRKIHLDFHTRPSVSGIGSAFDPEEFADIDEKNALNGKPATV